MAKKQVNRGAQGKPVDVEDLANRIRQAEPEPDLEGPGQRSAEAFRNGWRETRGVE